jgi:DnaJ like chaperone protein
MVSPWITGALGWAFFGPLGACSASRGGIAVSTRRSGESAGRAPGGAEPQAGPEAARNGFIASLLALTAAMMKADGRATKSELDVVKAFFAQQFGKETAQEALADAARICWRATSRSGHLRADPAEHELFPAAGAAHFLFSIAHADGELHPAEDRCWRGGLRSGPARRGTCGPIAAMFRAEADAERGLPRAGNFAERLRRRVRAGIRRMSMKHHPDKVAHLGAEFQKAATEKFQRVNAAYRRSRRRAAWPEGGKRP